MIARHGPSLMALACAAVCLTATPARSQTLLPGLAAADSLYDVEMVGSHAWIVGSPGVLLHSSDGGATFAPQGSLGSTALFAVDFVSETQGWVAGRGGQVLATSDGGTTWTPQATGTTEPLLAMDFFDATHGMAVGNFAAAVRTDDGGKSWKPMRVAPEGEDPTLNGVALLSATEAVVVGEFGGVWRTADAGLTWEVVDAGVSESLFGVAALGGSVLAAVGSEGTLVVSEDGGKTFASVDLGTRAYLYRVTLGAGRVILTGNRGVVLSADAVKGPYTSWTAPTYFWLCGAALGADGKGLLVGARGLALTTADGGKTWTRWGQP